MSSLMRAALRLEAPPSRSPEQVRKGKCSLTDSSTCTISLDAVFLQLAVLTEENESGAAPLFSRVLHPAYRCAFASGHRFADAIRPLMVPALLQVQGEHAKKNWIETASSGGGGEKKSDIRLRGVHCAVFLRYRLDFAGDLVVACRGTGQSFSLYPTAFLPIGDSPRLGRLRCSGGHVGTTKGNPPMESRTSP